ncbi:hypothetical protein PULV_a1698 [Pseudoalteromonas ulvae UL12]|uniref:cysteine desulfurase family protein n=1 Tax=Pseudoalteromonas ulvae TaxID=107327 RepID=UPI00186B6637|nr:cysteine desulfurase family protein [Pseudoalteromonas ulvae]MBE0364132.1 hypothetical protein [Pseudoalteromonas ulvae UL12]
MIYLDTAASYPLLPEVKSTLYRAFEQEFANSASSHLLGELINKKIDDVREKLADSIGAYSSEIIFTSGATESNNIAFKSMLLGGEISPEKKHIITTEIEHKCIFSICEYMKNQGYEITLIKPQKNGLICPNDIKKEIRPDTALVSVMHVNNELGTINPIGEIGDICVEKGVLFHSDAAQSYRKTEIDVDDMNVDIMSFSAHKIGGPKGIGAVYIRDLRHKMLLPVIHGAGQEQGIRGGTVAAPLIVGFGTAIEYFPKYYKNFEEMDYKGLLLKKLECERINFQVNGTEKVLPHCISLSLPEINVSVLLRENEQTICLAQGSACSSKEIEASHVLTSLGLTREQAQSTFRISFPLDLTNENIDTIVTAIKKAAY